MEISKMKISVDIEVDTKSKEDLAAITSLFSLQNRGEEKIINEEGEDSPGKKRRVIKRTRRATRRKKEEVIKPVTGSDIDPRYKYFIEDELRNGKMKARYGMISGLLLEMLKINGGMKASDMVMKIDMSVATAKAYLSTLQSKGLLESSTTLPKVYYLKGENEDVRELLKNVKVRGNKERAAVHEEEDHNEDDTPTEEPVINRDDA